MNKLLEIKNLNKKFDNHVVLQNVSFELMQGEIVGLVGKNGMGKTTLMKCILGLISPSSGSIVFDGDSGYKINKNKMNSIGYLLDCKLFENMNAYENIKIQEMYCGKHYKKLKEKQVIEDILKLVDLKNDKKKVQDYSFGMKQRLGLALALLGDTKLLILDEPFVGLDPVGLKNIKKFIMDLSKNKNITILISSHQLSEIENICDRFLYINNTYLYNYEKTNKKTVIIELHKTISDDFYRYFTNKEIKVSDNKITFEFNKILFNKVINYLSKKDIMINDIDIKMNGFETLFETGEHL